ncbi:MAG TPA: hypothetical protein VL172_04850 [Kofleriaceae bacterium]|nr:hypothetical protein [Kofleriaceae bacterium]
MRRTLLFLGILGGCAGVDVGDGDDGVPPEPIYSCLGATTIDADGAVSAWRIDGAHVPETVDEADQLGLNIDCDPDGRADNALGRAVAIVYQFESSNLNAEIAELIASGRLVHRLDLQTTDLHDAAGVGVTLVDPVDTGGAAEHPAAGFIVHGRLRAGGGELPLAITLPSVDDVMILPVRGASIDATFDEGRLAGRLGGAVPVDAVDTILLPFVHLSLSRAIERDCPDGTCADGSFGEDVLALFDADGDNQLTLEELRDSALVRALLTPDVDLVGHDGIPDGLSIGLGFTATP